MPCDDPSSSHSLNPQPHSVTSTLHYQTLNMNSNSSTECSSNEQHPPPDFPPIVEHLQSMSTFPNTNLKHEQGHEQLIRNDTSGMPSDINAFISMHGVSRNLPLTKEEEIKPSSVPFTSSSQHKIHLAAVPTQELSSRSIISLDPKLLGSDSILSSSSSKIPSQPPNRQFLQPLVVRNSLTDTKSSVRDTKGENKSPPQRHLLHQEQSSSKSLACDATLAAHQQQLGEWKNIANLTFVQSLPDTVIQASTVVKSISTRKRNFDTFQSSHKCVEVTDGKSTCSQSTLDSKQTLPEYFENLLQSRGYSTKHYCSLESGYHCKPTDLQKASYGMKFIEAVRTSNEFLLKKLLDAGLSPNPCNNFGESILHMICRRGDHKLLKIFLDYGSCIQICDDFGRTPLHDACWTSNPCFKIVEMLMNKDRWLLHIVDCRGSTPLNYVKKENWQKWKQFLDGQKDVWWPPRNVAVDGEEEPPKLLTRPAHSVPLPDPIGAPSCDHARAIANGIVELDNEECLDGKLVGRSLTPSVKSPRPETVVKQ